MSGRMFMVAAGLLSMLASGCDPSDKADPPASPPAPARTAPAPEKPKEQPKPIESKKTAMNKKGTLFLEALADGRRRVLIEAEVCLREGPLELLLCRTRTKEHEAILRADVDAQDVHTVLMVTGAKPGSPMRWVEKDQTLLPPHGTTIKITLQYEKTPGGEVVALDAKEWIRHMTTRKALNRDWVFAGSALFKDDEDPKKPPYYLANNGDVICVANFTDAMLDLPFASSKENADLNFECWTERIPPLKTKVTVILEPVLDKEKDKK